MIESTRARLAAIAVALLTALVVAACGNDENGSAGRDEATATTTAAKSDEPVTNVGSKRARERLLAVWVGMRRDFREGRMGAICSKVGAFGMDSFPPGPANPPGSCEQKLTWFAARMRERPPAERLRLSWIRVYEFDIGGITYVDADGDRLRVPFVRENGRWAIELGVFDRPEALAAPLEHSPAAAPVATRRPAETFAPYVRFHPRELWWPIAAKRFIDYGILSWTGSGCQEEEVAIGGPRRRFHRDRTVPIVDPRRLGGGQAYEVRPRRPECAGRLSTSYSTAQPTRPHDDGPRPSGLPRDSGFVLDVATGMRAGQPPAADGTITAPVYYEQRPERVNGERGLRITYWMLFGFERPLPEARGMKVQHEGDWEQVSVLLRQAAGRHRYQPVSVRYVTHGRRVDVPWREAQVFDATGLSGRATHPAVFAARGTHAPYPSPGVRRAKVGGGEKAFDAVDQSIGCVRCPAWATWRQLEPLRQQPWYGYRGAWGQSEDKWRTGVSGP